MPDAITLNRTTGKNEMAYVGETPWHGLGQTLTAGAPIETWKQEAGMNWDIERAAVQYVAGNGKVESFEGQEVLYRGDTHEPLGLVTPRYKIVQPGEVLEFFRDLVSAGGLELETAGTLLGGRKFWALAKTNHSLKVSAKDEVLGYLLLATSADGTMSTSARFTSVRVVCQNTLHIAMTQRPSGIKVPHSRVFDHGRVKQELGLLDNAWEEFGIKAKKMAKKKVTAEAARQFFVELFAKDPEAEGAKELPTVEKLVEVFESGVGQDVAGATVWGLVNATTRYLDHEKATQDVNIRLNNSWFKKGSRIKAAAWEMAEELVA